MADLLNYPLQENVLTSYKLDERSFLLNSLQCAHVQNMIAMNAQLLDQTKPHIYSRNFDRKSNKRQIYNGYSLRAVGDNIVRAVILLKILSKLRLRLNP